MEAKIEIGKTIISLGKDPSVGMEINLTIEAEEITIGTIIGPIIEIDQETTIGMMVGETTTDQSIGETITDKMTGDTSIEKTIGGTITEIDQIMKGTINRDIEIQVKVERIKEIIIEKIHKEDMNKIEIGIEAVIDKCGQEWECYQMKEKIGQGLDPILELAQIETG